MSHYHLHNMTTKMELDVRVLLGATILHKTSGMETRVVALDYSRQEATLASSKCLRQSYAQLGNDWVLVVPIEASGDTV